MDVEVKTEADGLTDTDTDVDGNDAVDQDAAADTDTFGGDVEGFAGDLATVVVLLRLGCPSWLLLSLTRP